MKPGESANVIPQNVRALLLVEIFSAYREINELKRKSCPPDMAQTLMDIRRGLDLFLTHLSPLGVPSDSHWDQLRAQ
ncbi:MAG TPA: hypothetical protein VFV23_01850 [Verrucomicrobiae bacterium]|nr:hypothetical protein [Verrucomicrobiae bacterium]